MDLGAQRFDYRVVSSICAISGVVLAGFAISHGVFGAQQLFLWIGTLAALLISFAWVTWRNRRIVNGAVYSVLVCANLVTLFALYKLEALGIYWVYPTLAVNFAFLQPKPGLISNIVFGAVAVFLASIWAPNQELIRIGLTFFTLMMFGFSFSYYLSKQHEELRRLANIDPLTGIGNRRALQSGLEESVDANIRYGCTASLLVIDLDHFKSINDAEGHLEGDRVLCKVVDLLQRRIRQTDRVFRYGGEEFVVLTPHTSLSRATQLAEQLRESVAELHAHTPRSITVSMGIAELELGETTEQWLARGDQALYRAKEGGRNKTVSLGTCSGWTHRKPAGDKHNELSGQFVPPNGTSS